MTKGQWVQGEWVERNGSSSAAAANQDSWGWQARSAGGAAPTWDPPTPQTAAGSGKQQAVMLAMLLRPPVPKTAVPLFPQAAPQVPHAAAAGDDLPQRMTDAPQVPQAAAAGDDLPQRVADAPQVPQAAAAGDVQHTVALLRQQVANLQKVVDDFDNERVTMMKTYSDLERRIAALEHGPADTGAASAVDPVLAADEEAWIVQPRFDGADYAWDEDYVLYRCLTCDKLLSNENHFMSYTHTNRCATKRAQQRRRPAEQVQIAALMQ